MNRSGRLRAFSGRFVAAAIFTAVSLADMGRETRKGLEIREHGKEGDGGLVHAGHD